MSERNQRNEKLILVSSCGKLPSALYNRSKNWKLESEDFCENIWSNIIVKNKSAKQDRIHLYCNILSVPKTLVVRSDIYPAKSEFAEWRAMRALRAKGVT